MKSENKIINSNISETARIFQNIRISNSTIESFCCVGDDSDIENSLLCEKSELGRRNLLRNTTLGRGSYTGTNAIIKNATIGKYCCFGWNISIGGGQHNYNNVSMYTDYWYRRTFGISSLESNKTNETALECHIGNDVWIGAGVNILGGVTIGNGCVIGAGAVVTKDIDPYSIVIGIPGKIVKKRFDEEIICLLEEIKWWDWPEEKIISRIAFLRDTPNKSTLKRFVIEGE